MALFSRTKKEDTAAAKPEKKETAPAATGMNVTDIARVLRNPRITEKASDMQAISVYAFDIAENVSKRQVIEAVRALYKVTPRKIAVVPIPKKTRRSMKTGKQGSSRGGKKAYVYLKKGETINLH